jgi:hypothetical protein
MRGIHKSLVRRIREGPGRASAELRARAFANAEAGELVDKVANRSAEITDADFAATGLSDDELFEVVICAAVGAASRQYKAGLAALDEATR